MSLSGKHFDSVEAVCNCFGLTSSQLKSICNQENFPDINKDCLYDIPANKSEASTQSSEESKTGYRWWLFL